MKKHAELKADMATGSHHPASGAGSRLLLRKHAQGPGEVDAAGRAAVPPAVHDVLHSPGQPLDAETRSEVESRLGHDFSRVRVHADGRASSSARSVGALAYTVGQNIVMGQGAYSPRSVEGRRLLAHELVHVAQQSGAHAGAVPAGVGRTDDDAEREADAAASHVADGRAGRPFVSVAGGPVLRRQPAKPAAKEEKLPTTPLPQGAKVKDMKSYLKTFARPEINELIKDKHDWWFDTNPFPIKEAMVNGVRHVWEWSIQPFNPPEGETGSFETGEPVDKTTKGAPGGPDTVTHTVTTKVPRKIGPNVTAESMFHELIHIRLFIDNVLPEDERSETSERYALMSQVAFTPLLIPLRERVKGRIKDVIMVYGRALNNPRIPTLATDNYLHKRVEMLVNEKFSIQETKKIWDPKMARKDVNADVARRYANAVHGEIKAGALTAVGQKAVEKAMQDPMPGDRKNTGEEAVTETVSYLESALKVLYDKIDAEMDVLQKIHEDPKSAMNPPADDTVPSDRVFLERGGFPLPEPMKLPE